MKPVKTKMNYLLYKEFITGPALKAASINEQQINNNKTRKRTDQPSAAMLYQQSGLANFSGEFGKSRDLTNCNEFGKTYMGKYECHMVCDWLLIQKVAQDVNRSGSVNSLVSLSSTRSEIDETPDLLSEPNLLTRSQMHTLAKKLPSRTVGHAWELAYSTMVHGISLATLYRNFTDYEGPTLLIVKDEHEKLFGAFLSEPPKVSDGFYGNGESMLYSFKQNHIKVYHWSGTNNFFVKGSKTSLAIGGGNGIFGIWLDEDLYRGRSHSCRTFDNTTLSEHEDFVCTGLEAWTFV